MKVTIKSKGIVFHASSISVIGNTVEGFDKNKKVIFKDSDIAFGDVYADMSY